MKFASLWFWPAMLAANVTAFSGRRSVFPQSAGKNSNIRRRTTGNNSRRRGQNSVITTIEAQYRLDQQQEEASQRQQLQQQGLVRRPNLPATQGDNNRALVWSTKAELCSADTRTMLNLLLFSTYCVETDIQWDKEGILTAKFFDAYGLTCCAVIIEEAVSLYQGYYNGQVCQNFTGCVIPVSGEEVTFPGQYSFDCSNVYCGPNAARACNGTYYDTPCPVNVEEAVALPAIPLLRNVNCELLHDLVVNGTEYAGGCGPCAEDDVDNAMVLMTCEPECLECNGNDSCVLMQDQALFSEHFRSIVRCVSVNDGPVGCISKTSPAQLGVNAHASLFGCSATLGDAACSSCSVCGFLPDSASFSGLYSSGDILYQADCTNIDKVSKYDECAEAFSGVFESFGRELNPSTCPDQKPAAPVVAPVFPAATTATVPVSVALQNTTSAPASTVQAPTFSSVVPTPVPEAAPVTIRVGVGAPAVDLIVSSAAPGLIPSSAPVTAPVTPPPVTAEDPPAGQPVQPQPLTSSVQAYVSLGTTVVLVVGLSLCAGYASVEIV